MKVVHYHFGKYGGAEGFFVHLVNGLAKRGVEQKVVIRPGRGWKSQIDHAAEVYAESHFRSLSTDRLIVPHRMNRLFKTWRPDAIVAWMSRAGHLLPSSPQFKRFARLGDYPSHLRQFKHADTLICNTPGIAEHVREIGWKKGVEVISNFTNTDRVLPIDRNELNTPENVPLICSVGRLVARKGFDVLIRSLTYSADVHLWIVGDGQELGNLRDLALSLGVDSRIRFVGWKSDPRPYVRASDISAMASSHEPLGNVILEGWAQHVPVVAARSEGPTWLIQHEENGILVNVNDAKGFAAAFNLLFSNEVLRNKLTRGGARSLEARFSERAVVDQYLELLSQGTQRAAA